MSLPRPRIANLVRACTIALTMLVTSSTSSHAMALQDLVKEVKFALLKVRQQLDRKSLPPLKHAELELNTEQKTDGGGKISLYIIEIGASGTRQVAQTIKLTLIPPPADSSADVADVKIGEELGKAIVAGVEAIEEAKRGAPALIPKEFKATIRFALTRDKRGGLMLTFPPFGAGGNAGLATAAVQVVTVTFGVD